MTAGKAALELELVEAEADDEEAAPEETAIVVVLVSTGGEATGYCKV